MKNQKNSENTNTTTGVLNNTESKQYDTSSQNTNNNESNSVWKTEDDENLESWSENTELRQADKSPFQLLRTNDIWNVVLGDQLISKGHKTPEEANENAAIVSWNRVLLVMTKLIDNRRAVEEIYDNARAEKMEVNEPTVE